MRKESLLALMKAMADGAVDLDEAGLGLRLGEHIDLRLAAHQAGGQHREAALVLGQVGIGDAAPLRRQMRLESISIASCGCPRSGP